MFGIKKFINEHSIYHSDSPHTEYNGFREQVGYESQGERTISGIVEEIQLLFGGVKLGARCSHSLRVSVLISSD